MRAGSGREVDQVVAVHSGCTLVDYAFLNSRERLARHTRFTALPTLLVARLFPLLDTIAEGLSGLLNRFAALFGFRSECRTGQTLRVLGRNLSLTLHPCGCCGI
jgi:hypothetical protein